MSRVPPLSIVPLLVGFRWCKSLVDAVVACVELLVTVIVTSATIVLANPTVGDSHKMASKIASTCMQADRWAGSTGDETHETHCGTFQQFQVVEDEII